MKKLALLLPCILVAGCATSPKAIERPHNVNGAMPALGMHYPRVAFVGDFQTYAWISAVQADQPDWINAATNAPETTASMLARFQVDVLDKHPDVVMLMGGMGDMTGGDWDLPCGDPGPATCDNLAAMVKLAQAAGIYATVASIPKDSTGPEDALTDSVFYFNDYLLRDQDEDGNALSANAFVNYDANMPAGWTDDGTLPNQTGINSLTMQAIAAIAACNCGGIR